MNRKARITLSLTRNTLRTLGTLEMRGVHGGRIDPSRVSGCGEDCPPRPPGSTHCITD